MNKNEEMPNNAVGPGKMSLARKAVHNNISSRIEKYIYDNDLTQDKFAKTIGVSSSTINRWISSNTDNMPPVYQLKKIADTLGITVDSLLTGSDVLLERPTYRTYSAAFLSLVELIDQALIPPASEDPFLNWLIFKKVAIDHMGKVSRTNKENWINKVVSDYNKPILPRYLTQYIELFKYEYAEIEEYDTYLTVFRLFQGYSSGETKDAVDGLIQRWKHSVIYESNDFAHVRVPYYGAGKLYALNEDGKTILTDFPGEEICSEIGPPDDEADEELPFLRT